MSFCLGFGIILGYTIFPYPALTDPNYYGILINGVYSGTVKVAEIIGLVLILVPGVVANNKLIINIFGNRVFNVLGNLVFGIYIFHMIVLRSMRNRTRNTIYLTYVTLTIQFIIATVILMIIAFIVFITIEKSCRNLVYKYVFSSNNKL